ncbi:hypothetical protein C8R44DRAFT_745331 [Mycena epipterygia]|nr:hypothetical protein C8R44DRAFT_745331 [Mycena epipterygia]
MYLRNLKVLTARVGVYWVRRSYYYFAAGKTPAGGRVAGSPGARSSRRPSCGTSAGWREEKGEEYRPDDARAEDLAREGVQDEEGREEARAADLPGLETCQTPEDFPDFVRHELAEKRLDDADEAVQRVAGRLDARLQLGREERAHGRVDQRHAVQLEAEHGGEARLRGESVNDGEGMQKETHREETGMEGHGGAVVVVVGWKMQEKGGARPTLTIDGRVSTPFILGYHRSFSQFISRLSLRDSIIASLPRALAIFPYRLACPQKTWLNAIICIYPAVNWLEGEPIASISKKKKKKSKRDRRTRNCTGEETNPGFSVEMEFNHGRAVGSSAPPMRSYLPSAHSLGLTPGLESSGEKKLEEPGRKDADLCQWETSLRSRADATTQKRFDASNPPTFDSTSASTAKALGKRDHAPAGIFTNGTNAFLLANLQIPRDHLRRLPLLSASGAFLPDSFEYMTGICLVSRHNLRGEVPGALFHTLPEIRTREVLPIHNPPWDTSGEMLGQFTRASSLDNGRQIQHPSTLRRVWPWATTVQSNGNELLKPERGKLEDSDGRVKGHDLSHPGGEY